MLTYVLDQTGGVSLYEALYRAIREDILSGALRPDERLPSKRVLAEHLSVSVITVEAAYAQLVAEGYLRTEQRRGYFVQAAAGEAYRPLSPAPGPTAPPADEWRIDLSRRSVSPDYFPFTVWARLMRTVILEEDKRLLQPLDYNGVPELREAIAAHLYRMRGMDVSPEQIVLGAGTEYLYQLLIQLLGRDKVYGLEDPGYRRPEQIYAANRVRFVRLGLDEEGLSVTALSHSDADIVHLSPAHHYPTGIVMPIRRRMELLQWAAAREGRYILEDDYDSEFRFYGRPVPTLFSADRRDTVIYMNTFSQTIAPSVRISYLCLPPSLMESFRRELGFYSCTVPAFEQYTLARFMREGHFERHLNRARKQYRQKRERLIAALEQSRHADRLHIRRDSAGLQLAVRVDTDLPDAAIRARAEARHIRLTLMSDCSDRPDDRMAHTLILHYAGAAEGDILTVFDTEFEVLFG